MHGKPTEMTGRVFYRSHGGSEKCNLMELGISQNDSLVIYSRIGLQGSCNCMARSSLGHSKKGRYLNLGRIEHIVWKENSFSAVLPLWYMSL